MFQISNMKWCVSWLVIVMATGLLQTRAQETEPPLTTTTGAELPSQTPPINAPSSTGPQPTTVTTGEEEEEELPYLIFAKRVALHRINLDGTELDTIIANSSLASNAIAIDFDARRDRVFWTDVREKVIATSRLDGTNATLLVDTQLTFPDGIAWDWINEKLYWSDVEHREIEVMDPATGDRMQLLETGSDTIPRDVAVDPNTRWLYWTDWGEVAKIERISMAGEIDSRQTLHETGLTWPNALTVDYSMQTLYWADAQLNKIEMSGVDGSNRTLLTSSMVLHPFALTYHNGALYWSDWQTDQIFTTNVATPNSVSVLVPTLGTEPMGLEVVTTARQPITSSNPCPDTNCSHLCLLSAASSRGYACACPRGMELDGDGASCIEVTSEPPTTLPEGQGSCQAAGYSSCCTDGVCLGMPQVCFCDHYCYNDDSCCHDIATTCPKEAGADPTTPPRLTSPFIMFANRRSINQMMLDGSSLSSLINTTVNSIALDYNYRDQYIYWTDVSARSISRAKMDGSEATVLISSNIGIPDGLACDWVTNKLYWTDALTKSITVYDLDNGYRLRLLGLASSSTPRAIVVDPLSRWLFWSDWGTPAKIERASMDGTLNQTIINTDLIWPNALSIDRKSQLLFWADASLDKIESSNIDGSNRRVLLRTGILHPFSIVAFNNTLYWSDWQADTIFSSRLIGTRLTNSTSLLQRLSEEPMMVQVISPELQTNLTNPCETDNGNCSHFCLLSTSERGVACACPNGYVFEEGSTESCIQIPDETTPPQPLRPGSCQAAGYTTCCVDGLCEGLPPTCFCDSFCFEFDDCCDDFREICPGPGDVTSIVSPPTTTMTLPSPSSTTPVTSSSATESSIVPSLPLHAFTSNVVLERSRRSRTSSLLRPTTISMPDTTEPVEDSTLSRSNLVSVGVVVGSLLASVFTIVSIALMVVLIVTVLIIRQRNAFSRYEIFGETNNKEMTMIGRRLRSQPAHEAKA